MSISIETAQRVLEASKQRAKELRSPVSIAIVDAGGHLVLFERMMAPYGFATGNISIAKASTAVMFNQSTDSVAQWGATIPGFASSLAAMTDGKFIMAAGGFPLRVNSVTIGGIGISGGNAPGRDDEIAQAGLRALEIMAPAPQPFPPAAQPKPDQRYMPPQQPAPLPSQPYTQSLYSQEPINNKSEVHIPSQAVNGERASGSNQNYRQTYDENSSQQPGNENNSYNAYRSNSANPPDVDRPGDNA